MVFDKTERYVLKELSKGNFGFQHISNKSKLLRTLKNLDAKGMINFINIHTVNVYNFKDWKIEVTYFGNFFLNQNEHDKWK
jgi:hypothetical protein